MNRRGLRRSARAGSGRNDLRDGQTVDPRCIKCTTRINVMDEHLKMSTQTSYRLRIRIPGVFRTGMASVRNKGRGHVYSLLDSVRHARSIKRLFRSSISQFQHTEGVKTYVGVYMARIRQMLHSSRRLRFLDIRIQASEKTHDGRPVVRRGKEGRRPRGGWRDVAQGGNKW